MLRVIGLNHHSSPLDVREQLAFTPEQAAEALDVWQDTTADTEAVILSTCNRTEFYTASQSQALPSSEFLLQFLLEQKNNKKNLKKTGTLTPAVIPVSHIFILDDADAAEHLFSVSSGLDSMVLGDMQISSQVKSAYQQALEAETAGTILHTLFQTALKTAKRVATETDLHRHKVSIPSIAVTDFAMRIFETLHNKRILVFGAGEMAEETLTYLTGEGGKDITVLNRHRERAEALAAKFGGTTADWDKKFEVMRDADIIVSATGSSEPVVTLNDYRTIEKTRGGKTLFVLDLAVPRDFAPEIGKCSGVYLYSIDDLQETCSKNRTERDKAVPKAERIVKQTAQEFIRDIAYRKSGIVIQKLRERWSKTKEAELERLFNKLPDLTAKQREEIQYTMERLTAKFLHPPMESLRGESAGGEASALLNALAKLFKIS
ncbi:MAG: glutamyl-tRNA reductase [Planctomycetaceae bacterium]|jgi:glutamyl-tRNA reductase|nr:glutamyl-tRNA reductase [Planctomycetaceae bacterium]